MLRNPLILRRLLLGNGEQVLLGDNSKKPSIWVVELNWNELRSFGVFHSVDMPIKFVVDLLISIPGLSIVRYESRYQSNFGDISRA